MKKNFFIYMVGCKLDNKLKEFKIKLIYIIIMKINLHCMDKE